MTGSNILRKEWLMRSVIKYNKTVAYLPHARTVEPQKQPNTRTNSGTIGLCNPLLGNGSVNTLPSRRSEVTLQQYLAIT
jgi:hypothetical protein